MRHAGVVVPLFSTPSASSWGIGELADVAPLSEWLAHGGFDRLMLLPLGTMASDQTSPYSAASAMAIDPIYIAVADIEDFQHAGGVDALSDVSRSSLANAQAGGPVQHDIVRRVKDEGLALGFEEFLRREWSPSTGRAARLAAYAAREHWWLDDYALFQALSEAFGTHAWQTWPASLRDREAPAIDDARRQHEGRVLFHQYLQWIAETQWQAARAVAASRGVAIVGDLPFAVDAESADVWARAGEFMLDASLGTPPDAFSEDGQDWGLPVFRWDVIAEGGFAWIRDRARRMAALFSAIRIDHLVGFYRTYARPHGAAAFFTPPGEAAQIRQGETILQCFLESGAGVLAEDLGTVPDFVRASLGRLGVAGCKVLRWERNWKARSHPFLNPSSYPVVSAAMTGTHDTTSLSDWWNEADEAERRAFLKLPQLKSHFTAAAGWTDTLRDALLELMYRSGSNELLLPIQDLFGWPDRINVPGTVTDANWTWRLPWPVNRLAEIPEAVERAQFCRRMADAGSRGLGRSERMSG